MQWIADRFLQILQRLTAKSPSEELIVSWPVHRVVIFRVFPNHDLFTLFFRNHFLCFLLPFFFQIAIQKRGAHYTPARIIHG